MKKSYYTINSLIYNKEFLNRYFVGIKKNEKNQKKLNLINLCFNQEN